MTDSSSATPTPSTSVEVERKYDAESSVKLPDWTQLEAVDSVSEVDVRDLDALYFDSDALEWGRAGYAVRRRTGGPDAGWHIKGPMRDGGRTETAWTEGLESDVVPDFVCLALPTKLQGAGRPSPLARLETTRRAYALLDGDGALVAEVVDDHVRATDLRAARKSAWREWEVELGRAAPDDRELFFSAVDALVFAAGAKPASSTSKLARALRVAGA